jgi:hypothetical protein
MPLGSPTTPPSSTRYSFRRIVLSCLAFAFIAAILTPHSAALQRYRPTVLQNSGNIMHFQNPFKSGESSTPSETSKNLPRPNGKVNIVYFTNWAIYGRKFRPQDIPAKHVTRESLHMPLLHTYSIADGKSARHSVLLR